MLRHDSLFGDKFKDGVYHFFFGSFRGVDFKNDVVVDVGAFDPVDFFVALPVSEMALDGFGGGLTDKFKILGAFLILSGKFAVLDFSLNDAVRGNFRRTC